MQRKKVIANGAIGSIGNGSTGTVYMSSNVIKTACQDGIVTVTINGITTQYRGNVASVTDGVISIDGVRVTASDPRIIPPQNSAKITSPNVASPQTTVSPVTIMTQTGFGPNLAPESGTKPNQRTQNENLAQKEETSECRLF